MMRIRSSKPTAAGRIVFRIRFCHRCGLMLESREFAPDYDQLARDLEPFTPELYPQPKAKGHLKAEPKALTRKRRRRALAVIGSNISTIVGNN